MSETMAVIITGVMALVINYTNIMLVFPLRFNKWISACLPVIFTSAFYAFLLLNGSMNDVYGGLRGFVHLPLAMLLVRGQVFQKLFCFISQALLAGFWMSAAKILAGLFASVGSEEYYLVFVILAVIFYMIYVLLVYKFGKQFVTKLFIGSSEFEWVVYTFGALLSFIAFAIVFETITNTLQAILLMLSILWSYCILCFAIINTHEKAKQRYEAEYARDIISSGRGHYEKMNELRDTLRLLRHDYKLHMNAVSELLNSGRSEEAGKYLEGVQEHMPETELPNYCRNTVINALLAGYAERFGKLNIKYKFKVTIPESASVPNYEMCIILGNLLENALEACLKQKDRREIELAVKPQGAQLAIMVKNSCAGVMVIQEEGRLVSVKKDGGLGLKSVRAVAESNGGELITEWDRDTFTTYVLTRL